MLKPWTAWLETATSLVVGGSDVAAEDGRSLVGDCIEQADQEMVVCIGRVCPGWPQTPVTGPHNFRPNLYCDNRNAVNTENKGMKSAAGYEIFRTFPKSTQ